MGGMRIPYIVGILLLIFPAFLFAQELQAGFPAQALWVSKMHAAEGERINISTVVYNGDTAALQGTLYFKVDGVQIGARVFELPAGESEIFSIAWSPSTGEHRITATIESSRGVLSLKETAPVIITIAEPPPPTVVQKTTELARTTVHTIASSSVPVVQKVATGIFETVEPVRKAGVERLETYLAPNAPSSRGTVAGTSTVHAGSAGPAAEKENLARTAAQAAAAGALFLLDSLYIFYPLLAFLLLGTLYLLARRIRRRP